MVKRLFAIAFAGTLGLAASAWGATPETLPSNVPEIVPLGPLPPAPMPAAPASSAPRSATQAPATPVSQTTSPETNKPAAQATSTGTSAPTAPAATATTGTAAPEATSPAAGVPAPQPATAAPATPQAAPSAAPAAGAGAPPQASEGAAPKGDLWVRIRQGFAMPDLTGKKAANSTHWYAEKPDYIDRMAGRASLYEYYIVQEIEKRGLPTELALLPFVESA